MSSDFLAIVDYGSGNLRSAAKAFERVIAGKSLPLTVKVTSRPEDILAAARIVLPGQGAFGQCMEGLSAIPGMLQALHESVQQRRIPFLGICVGMQLLATRGLEHGDHAGLDWIPGTVRRMEPSDPALKIPHMGWNEVRRADGARASLLRSIESPQHYYFVHSFVFESEDRRDILAYTDYGGAVTAIVGRGNIVGVQFHPEKSQRAGLDLIADFLDWMPDQ